MIKKLFLPFIIILISFLLIINYLAYKSPIEAKLITQQKAYSVDNNNSLNILIYANKKTAFQEKEAIEKTYLCNFDETKKLEISLNNIRAVNDYKYLKETYKEYMYTFSLPVIDNYFYIEDAYLFIRLKNSKEMNFKLGSLDYYNNEPNLDITELYGQKHADFPTLKTINIRFNLTEDIFIEHVYLANNVFTYVGKTITNDELVTIDFPKLDKITDKLIIRIDYQISGALYTTTTPYFMFYESIENPLIHSVLNNVYILDWGKKHL